MPGLYGAPTRLCALPGDHQSRWWVRGQMHFMHLYFLPEHFTQRAVRELDREPREVTLADRTYFEDARIATLCQSLTDERWVAPESDDHYSLMDCLELFSDRDVRTPMIASGGLTPSNVVDIVQNYPVWGVDVRAGVEKSVGEKDPVLLGQFIANARWAFDNTYAVRRHDEWPM